MRIQHQIHLSNTRQPAHSPPAISSICQADTDKIKRTSHRRNGRTTEPDIGTKGQKSQKREGRSRLARTPLSCAEDAPENTYPEHLLVLLANAATSFHRDPRLAIRQPHPVSTYTLYTQSGKFEGEFCAYCVHIPQFFAIFRQYRHNIGAAAECAPDIIAVSAQSEHANIHRRGKRNGGRQAQSTIASGACTTAHHTRHTRRAYSPK